MALQYHPDKNPGNKAAEDKIKQVNEAYRTLKQKNAPYIEQITVDFSDFRERVDDWYDSILIRMLEQTTDSMRKFGHPNYLFTFIEILKRLQNKALDAETKQKIEQLNQIAATIKKLNQYVSYAYLGDMIAILGMMAYNLVAGSGAPNLGLVVYPTMLVVTCVAALTQDKVTKKTVKSADLARDITQKVR